MPLAEQWFADGRAEGERRMLARFLTLKFGELPADALMQLSDADEEQLTLWVEHLEAADTLDELLRETKTTRDVQ